FKLKGSFGKTGNDAGINPFAYRPTFQQNDDPVVVINGQPVKAIYTSGVANPDLKWETTLTRSVGFESVFLNGKFGFDFEWFYKHTKGILGAVSSLYPLSLGGYFPTRAN